LRFRPLENTKQMPTSSGKQVAGGTMKFLRIGVAAFAIVTIVANGVSAHTLTDALIKAYRNSAQLKSEQASLRATDEGVAQAWAALRPTLSGTATGTRTHFFSTGNRTTSDSLALSASLLMWDGGNTELGVEVARMAVVMAREGLNDIEQQVLLNAVVAFMDMRRDAQFLQLADSNRRVIAKQVQAAKDRFEVGEIRRTDVSQAEARLAGALSIVAIRQGNLEIAREAFHVAVGEYPDNLQSPPALPRIPSSIDAAKSISMRNHPTILRSRHLLKIADLNVLRAEAAMKVSISLSGSLSVSSTSTETASISIIGSVPIYSGGALASAHRQTLALQEKARADIQLAGLLVSQNTTRYWAQLQIAKASITARQKEVRASRVALRGIREEADLGARTTLDVLDAEASLVGAETNIVAAKRDQYVAVYSLLSAMGLLTVNHLQLGIKTYDPNINYNAVSTAPPASDRGKLLEKIFTRAGKK
jgi:outer membrane protein